MVILIKMFLVSFLPLNWRYNFWNYRLESTLYLNNVKHWFNLQWICKHTLQSCEASFKRYNLWLLWLADDLHLLQVGSRSSKQKSVKISPCSLHAKGSFLQRSRKPSQVFSSVVLTMSSPIDDGWQQRGHSQDPPPFHRLSRQSLQKRCLQNSTTGFCRIFPQMGHDRSSAKCDCLEAIALLSPSLPSWVTRGYYALPLT